MNRVYNFSAGPSILPIAVLNKMKDELINYKNSGQSVMEMSHRSNEFLTILNETKNLLKEVLNIDDDYDILFLQGGASTQFAMVPLNLSKNKKADYITTGLFSKKALDEASKFLNVNEVASSADRNFSYIPKIDDIKFQNDANYTHITLNNTIFGTMYKEIPSPPSPLVCDFSSCALGFPLDIKKFSLLYAGAQKNMGIAGLCVVIIKKALIKDNLNNLPTMLSYKTHSDNNSMYNTPPTFPIYVLNLILNWIKSVGGLSQVKLMNEEKANILYNFLDNSRFFNSTVEKTSRSLFNIPFTLKDESLNDKFLNEAREACLINLKGHRKVGGMRASIYNGMPKEGVLSLVSFMEKFEKNNN